MKITYRMLMAISGFSLHQLKRWALKLFGIDPTATKSGGDIREFSDNQGFLLYLQGILVATYRIGVEEAGRYVLRIFDTLEKMAFSPAQLLRENKFNYSYPKNP